MRHDRFGWVPVIWLALVCMASSLFAQQPRTRGLRRPPDEVHEGEMAPDFTLKSLDGHRQVTLSDFRGNKAVALVFGSYT